MRLSSCVAVPALLLLGTVTACAVEDAPEDAPASAAAALHHCQPAPPPVSTMTPLANGDFRFTSTAVMEARVLPVWAKVRDIEQVVEIALPGIASDFAWENGGSAAKVPSQFQFVALGSTMHEEVFYRSFADKELRYRLVTPGLGITSYVASMRVTDLPCAQSQLVFSRDLRFEDPAAAPGFLALFETEIANMQAYFLD